jgi:Family of unknown function (DUF6802)
VFIEESGADLTVTVEGEEYHTPASVDIDSNGMDDTAIVETDDGAIEFTDTDADGQADLMTQFDADGDIIGQARFDKTTGDWVHIDDPRDPHTHAPHPTGATGSVTGSMTVDTPHGSTEVGPPTDDTDGDGHPDTIVVTDTDGDTLIFTDADEDGDADYATEITGDGTVTVSEHHADGNGTAGDWTIIERGHLDEHGAYHQDPTIADAVAEESGWVTSSQPDPAEVRIDPRTGDWTRGPTE